MWYFQNRSFIRQTYLILFGFLWGCASWIGAQETSFIQEVLQGVEYVFCLDGGGSKTALQVLDANGVPCPLYRDGKESLLLQGECSNIIVVGEEGVVSVLEKLFVDLKVGSQREKIKNILSKSAFVGGFAGIGREEQKEAVFKIIEKFGFLPEKIALHTDAGMALELVGENGAILIGGTGSICFIKEKEKVKRFGGLGYRIGDDGSGYYIGLRGIKAALQEEYGYSQQTSLTPLIKEYFGVDSMLKLIEPINGNKEPPSRIAAIAPFVFQEAWKGDEVAYQIIEESAHELGDLVAKGVQTTEIKHCLIYLVGGLFQNEEASLFIHLLCKSPAMQQLKKGLRPILVNISEKMIPSLVVQEKLRLLRKVADQNLFSLPFAQEAECDDFYSLYNREFLTTEQHHEESQELSRTFYKSHLEGMRLIHKLDYSVLDGAYEFAENFYEKTTQTLLKKIKSGGRVFIIGSGSSGRLAIDLAAKWKAFFESQESESIRGYQNAVQGIIAGGARAFVKARDRLEDSEYLGYRVMREHNLSSKDLVILISASASSNFVLGAAKAANDAKATSYYFYNTKILPSKSRGLLENKNLIPIHIDVGPQTITGSTRLQAASLAEFSWGMVLSEALCHLIGSSSGIKKNTAFKWIEELKKSWDIVGDALPEIQKIVDLEIEVFSDEKANFWKAYDETYHGYVTFLSAEDCLREIMVDTTETPPHFSANPPRSTSEQGMKKAEYRAFMVGEEENIESWKKLIGREVSSHEYPEVSGILLAIKAKGYGDYRGRTISNKNFIIGVFSTSLDFEKSLNLVLELNRVKDKGLKTALIVLEEEGYPLNTKLIPYLDQNDVCVEILKIPYDHLHLLKTLTLKQILNLISNSAMIGMNKVYGNVMIDVAADSDKLIDRSIRIIQEVYQQHHKQAQPFKYEYLFHYVTRAIKYKELVEAQLGKHIPSPSKLVLTMLEKNCDVEKAVALLKMNNENIDLILSEI